MNRMRNRITALAMAAIFAASFSLTVFTAFADSDVINIGSEKEFADFAAKCKTDTWSQGKTVYLSNDIDVSKIDFSYVPTFGGIFDGNGYTISGVNTKTKGSNLGLFRYVQSCGVVENLNVSGNMSPEGTKKNIGGIVGENSGTIKNCSFNGNVSGDASVGGICGYITESGRVYGCEFNGSVTGKSYTGGIAGQNYGTVELCKNNGNINTTDNEESKTIQDINIDVSELGTTESIDTATDTGGICGFSKGRIISCKNYGDVGYKSVGYNTGGICGRQSGFLTDCENYATINGRKDIGGIAGQAEPYILLEYTEDILKQVDDIFSRMQNIIDNNALQSDNDLWDSLDRIDSKASAVTSSTQALSDDAEKYADELAASVNDVADRLHTAIDNSSDVLDDISNGGDKISEGVSALAESCGYLKNTVDNLADAKEHFDDAAKFLQKASKRLSAACDELEDCASDLNSGTEKLVSSIKALAQSLKDMKSIEESFKEIWADLGEISKSISGIGSSLEDIADVINELHEKGYLKSSVSSVVENLKALAQCYKNIANAISGIGDACLLLADSFDVYSVRSTFSLISQGMDYLSKAVNSLRLAVDDLEKSTDDSDGLSQDLGNALSRMQDSLECFRNGMDYISSGIDGLSDIADEFTKGETFRMPVASEIFGNDFENFFDAIKSMQDELSELKNVLKSKKKKMSDDIDGLSDELNSVSGILSDAYNEHVRADKDGFIEDVSNVDSFGDIRGKIESSFNLGAVFGDINTGGIVGSMAIEYDFDPEDDIKKSGDKSLKFTYRTKCVVRRCRNEAVITAKKNYCGGVVGRMDLGSVISCENYGNISNSDGNYTGGIAGLSDTTVRNSVSKCSLSGADYVGGIAGQGSSISNCFALVNVSEYGECAGSIAGFADKDSSSKSFFVSDTLGGIDDINYTGIAEETDIDSFVNFVKSNFGTDVSFTLVFVCDDEEIARVPFIYKESISKDKIPKVPEKKGYYGKWSEYNFDEAHYDAIITAEYYRDIELIESDLKRDNGKSTVLICGAFDDSARVKATKNNLYPDKLKRKNVLEGYDVEIEGVYNEKYTVRYLPVSEKGNANIFVECGGSVEKVKTKRLGSYLEFETSDSSFKMYEVKKSYVPIWILMAVLIGAAGCGAVFAFRKII